MRFSVAIIAASVLALGSFARGQDTPAYSSPVLVVSGLQNPEEGVTKEMERKEGTLRCGQMPSETAISWKFLQRSAKGDVYRFTQILPDGKAGKSEQIIYDNAPVTVWKDDTRMVMVKPQQP